MTNRLAALVLISFMLAGCSQQSERGPLVEYRDSAGISIAENPSPDDSASNAWWHIEGPLLDIGGFDVEEPYALFRVSDALRLADGRIVVGSSASDDVRYFDETGAHLKTSGRSGGGPGEYENVGGLERGLADSLLVIDPTSRRVSVLNAAGDYVRQLEVGSGALVTRVVGLFDDGSLLTAPVVPLGPEPGISAEALIRPPFMLVRITHGTGAPDTLGEFPGADRLIRVASSSGRITSIEIAGIPFGRSPTFAAHGTDVYIGSQDDAEIPVYGQDGILRRIIRTGRAREPVTESHLAAQFEEFLESLTDERRKQVIAAGGQEGPHGEYVPPYGELMTDQAGNLWVSDFDDPLDTPGRWTVYGSDGGVLARIVLPERFRPYDIGDDWLLGRDLDELDVEHVRLYRLVKGQ